MLNYVKNTYELPINELNGRLRGTSDNENRPAELYQQAIQLQVELIDVERMVLTEQRQSSLLDGEVLRKMEQQLNLQSGSPFTCSTG